MNKPFALVRKLSTGLLDPLPEHWQRHTNKDGALYYVHTLTGIATNQKPKPLPANWRMTKDKSSGVIYFWNVQTRETRPCTWEAPPPPPHATTNAPPASAASVPPVGAASAPPADAEAAVDVYVSACMSAGASTVKDALSSPPPPPPPLAPDSVRVRLSAEAFAMITFAPTKSGRSVVVTRVQASPATAAVHEGAVVLAIDSALCPSDAADAMLLLQQASARGEEVAIELTQQPEAQSDDLVPTMASIRIGKRISDDI